MEKIYNKKIIIVSILLFLISLSVGFYFWNNKAKSTEDVKTKEPNNTIKIPSSSNTNIDNTITNTKSPTTENIPQVSRLQEKDIILKTEENINLWKETKNKLLLKEAVELLHNTSVESVMSPWKFLIENDSNTVFELVDSNSTEDFNLDVYFIFEWYIFGSGNFDKLSSEKKQEISNQYLELKKMIN